MTLHRLHRPLAVLVLLAGCGFGWHQAASARDLTSLQGEFWVDFQPMGKDGPLSAPPLAEAEKALLDEARTVFSAMIYGYDFSYRPGDKARQAEESFVLTPAGQIPWGDGDMEFREMRRDEASLYLRVRYFTKEHEQRRLLGWTASHNIDAGATGASSYFQGVAGKLKAFESACKEAIRAYARGISFNKPDRIEGHFIVSELPREFVASGEYRNSVRLKLQLTALDSYRNW